MMMRPTALYRCYDAAGALLYIGTTEDIKKRLKQHAGQNFWASDVFETTTEIHESGYAARAAERDAIALERPKYNVMGNEPSVRYTAPQGAVDVLIAQMNSGESFGRAAIAAKMQASVAQGVAKKLGLKFADGRNMWRSRATGVPPSQIKPELAE